MSILQVDVATCTSGSDGLFDFQSSKSLEQSFSVTDTTKFGSEGSSVQVFAKASQQPATLQVERHGNSFLLATPGYGCKSRGVRRVVRPSEQHTLAEDDTIKLGRVKVRVSQIVLSEADLANEIGQVAETSSTAALTQTPLCRICLMDGSSDIDPLVSPCECRGSIGHVHVGCLRKWISIRGSSSNKASGSFLSCDLCKKEYSTFCQVADKVVPLLEPPFVILKNMRQTFAFSFAENQTVKIGRSIDADIRLTDLSISREHATVCFRDGNVVLEARSTKYGTTVETLQPVALDPGCSLCVQNGRHLFSASVGLPYQSSTVVSVPAFDAVANTVPDSESEEESKLTNSIEMRRSRCETMG